ncbi:cilia- and flagella-associated protein 53 [Pyrgilauda ruficollis]|uniref:cilia- and flagella-associated protein 53 n=1 Tax=Pyrgilauda ruficollis TaxID=221976 RepID=UPI001B861FDD|nr:cilia- and flagella-associated protein 53 [Pyrgilauda ruficollis]
MAARPPPRPQPPHCSHTLRRREFTGCGPHELALIAKPTKRDLFEETILAERELEEEQREHERVLRVFRHYRNVCDWHKGGEDKWMQRAAERKVRATLQQYLQEIEVRRERLRDFLEAEESRHLAEVRALDEENAQQREVKMKEQAKLLREKKEQERLQVVAEKREQQFRNQSHEYREHCKKLSEKELGDCQLAQQTLKEILKKEEKMQERKLEEICEKELLAKDQEAELKAQEVAARIREMVDVRDAQVAVHAAHREEKKQEIRQDAERLEKELHQLRKENEDLERRKLHQQKECREIWLKAVQDRQKHLDAEKQIQLAEEKVILENDFHDTDKEHEKIRNKKQTLLKEQVNYLDHLAEQLRKEKEQEREDEKIFKEERDKVWAERVEKLKQERKARFQLLRDVMNTRQSQMMEKLQKKEERKIEIAKEKKAMAEAVRKFEYEEEEERIRKAQKAKEYRDQLASQIAYQQWLQKAEEEKRKKEYEANIEAEREYQEKIQLILAKSNKSEVKSPTAKRALMPDS